MLATRPHLIASLLLFTSWASHRTASGFSTPSFGCASTGISRKVTSPSIEGRRTWVTYLSLAENKDVDSWDSEEDYAEFNKNLDGPPEDDFELNLLSPKGKLGINIGKEMGISKLTPEEAADLKREASEAIESAFSSQMKELEKLRENMKKEFDDSKQAMNAASDLRAARETERLMEKVDNLMGDFLRDTKQSRDSTKLAAAADQNMVGRGLEFGSWGTDDSGREVVTLGDVGSSFYIEESVGDAPASDSATQKKILVVVDESKSKEDWKLGQQIAALFEDIPNTQCEAVAPIRVPTGGGNNCKVALIFASSVTDRSDMERLLERLLKRTVTSGFPPTHLVLVSSLGTGRTNKMPYSMQNLLGGKLDRKREIEEAIVSRSRMGLFGGARPLDYTIVKFGEQKPSGSISTKGGSPESAKVKLAYGDALDGNIELDDAVQVIFQSIALQKSARNCTFSAVTDGTGSGKPMSQEEWDDAFVRLDGPELARFEIKKEGDKEVQYQTLCEYIQSWGLLFEEDGGRKVGLSTPVSVTTSPGAVKLEFRTTKTGSAYKSSKEERALETERQKRVTQPSDDKTVETLEVKKETKQGGVEVLVEREPVLRVRAKRCNMGPDTIVKEMSEELILKRLRDAVKFWVESK